MAQENPDTSSAPNADALFTQMTAKQIAEATAEAQGWNPAKGDELDGVVLAIKAGDSEHRRNAGRDPKYPILFVLTDDLVVHAVHCFQAVLENEVKSQRPQVGERIYIKHIGATGEAKVKGQSPPVRYAVQVQREAGTSDPWDHL